MTKEQYIIFLSEIYTKNDGGHLSPSSVKHYGEEALLKINQFVSRLFPDEYESLFDIDSYHKLLEVKKIIFQNPDFRELDIRGKSMYSAGFNRYLEFASGKLLINKEKYLPLLDRKEEVKNGTLLHEREIPARDRIKILQAEQACSYNCQIDRGHKTFISMATGHQYMDGHHIIPLSQQEEFTYSLDCYANIIVLCPTCHRFMHYGLRNERREKLIAIYEDRAERFSNSGILIDRSEFLNRAESAFIYR